MYRASMTQTFKTLVIDPDGSCSVVPTPITAARLKAVLGGWLEAAAITDEWVAYCDEEGMLKHLPPNPLAAEFLMSHYGQGVRNVAPVGRVVICGHRYVGGEDGYENTDLPASILDNPMIIAAMIDL